MPRITINKGGPSVDIEDGVYPVILVKLDGPKTIYPANAPDGTVIYEWAFVLDDERGDQELQGTTSTASGPKSKMFGWITALMGKAPAAGDSFDSADLEGRRALATIGHNDGGWPRIDQLTAIPAAMLQQKFAQATGAPTNGTPVAAPATRRPAPANRTPLNLEPTPASAQGDELPF